MKRFVHLTLVMTALVAPSIPYAGSTKSDEGQRSRFEQMFRLNDTNGDGHVSLEEFQARSARVFNTIDTNGDGKISPEEMRDYHQKQFQKVIKQQRDGAI